MTQNGWLFPDSSQLHRLERLSVAAKGRIRGTTQGKRRSRLLGSSLEFADYRPYAPGDDIRRLDWNVYGRTGKAFIRQFWDEQEMNLRLYIDASPSMRFGYSPSEADGDETPSSTNKLACALRMAACVGYAALAGEDRVSACIFADRLVSSFPTVRGKGAALRLFDYLEKGMTASAALGLPGTDDLSVPFSQPGAFPRSNGQCWLFTDGLYGHGVERVLNGFAAAGQHLVVVHVLGPEELSPELAGELKLIDSESGATKEVAFGKGIMEAYQAALRQHIEDLHKLCAQRGFDYVLADTAVPAVEIVSRTLLAGD